MGHTLSNGRKKSEQYGYSTSQPIELDGRTQEKVSDAMHTEYSYCTLSASMSDWLLFRRAVKREVTRTELRWRLNVSKLLLLLLLLP